MIAVTNRQLCMCELPEQIQKVCALGVSKVIFREKDLAPELYRQLAKEVLPICESYQVQCVLHKYTKVARELGCHNIHLPLQDLLALREKNETLDDFRVIGASVHSVEDAKAAEEAGATYLTAGHIYQTQCKPGLAPRGIAFLKEVCEAVSIPVYGIGGIHEAQISEVLQNGAAGACMMSEMMRL